MYWYKILKHFTKLKKETDRRGRIMARIAESTDNMDEYWYNRGLADAHKWDADKMNDLIDIYKVC